MHDLLIKIKKNLIDRKKRIMTISIYKEDYSEIDFLREIAHNRSL